MNEFHSPYMLDLIDNRGILFNMEYKGMLHMIELIKINNETLINHLIPYIYSLTVDAS